MKEMSVERVGLADESTEADGRIQLIFILGGMRLSNTNNLRLRSAVLPKLDGLNPLLHARRKLL